MLSHTTSKRLQINAWRADQLYEALEAFRAAARLMKDSALKMAIGDVLQELSASGVAKVLLSCFISCCIYDITCMSVYIAGKQSTVAAAHKRRCQVWPKWP